MQIKEYISGLMLQSLDIHKKYLLKYSGFCIHSLVKGVGLVVLSNPQIGIFNWKNQNFLVSSVKAAIEFRRDPDSLAY